MLHRRSPWVASILKQLSKSSCAAGLKAGTIEDGVQMQAKGMFHKRKGPIPQCQKIGFKSGEDWKVDAQRAISAILTERLALPGGVKMLGEAAQGGSQNKKTLLGASRRAIIKRTQRKKHTLES